MYSIEIRSSCIVLNNYNFGDDTRIERMFSIWDRIRHRYKQIVTFYDKSTKKYYIPRGINLYYLYSNNIQESDLKHISPDLYENIGAVMLKYEPRDERQKEAIKFCLGLEKYKNNRNASQISLNICTGAGKTYCAIFTFAYYQVKTMMITSSVSWLEQWKEKILEYTDLKENEIYIISGSQSIENLLNGKVNHHNIRFYLSTHSTLYQWGKNNGWESVRTVFQTLKIGIKIYDEAHLYFENICRIDYFTNCWKTYYLTATPSKSDYFENKIYQKSFECVPKIDLYDEENDPHSKYLSILINTHPNPYQISRCTNNQYGFSVMNYIDYFATTDQYYKILKIILAHCFSQMTPEEKILIYIGKNEVIQQTYNWLRYYYNSISIGLYSNLTPKQYKKQQLDCTLILTTTKSASALLDISNLKFVVVLNEPYNSLVTARQQLGRLRNRNTELIDVVDVGFFKLKDWYLNKLKNIYSKYCTEVNEITYSNFDINRDINELNRLKMLERETNKKNLKTIVQRVSKNN